MNTTHNPKTWGFNFGIRFKLIATFIAVVTVLAASMGTYAYYTMKNNLISSAQEKLKSDINMGRELINQYFPGPWSLREGRLYKGETLMEGNFAIVDMVGNLTGDTATIFRENIRVATNVTKNGERQVNTPVSEQVAAVVLSQGKTYLGEADVVGTRNLTAYEPIRDSEGRIIGIWYVGVPITPYENIALQFRNHLIVFGVLGYLIAILAVAFLTNRMFVRPLVTITEASQKVAQGDLTSQLDVSSRDEIGRLAKFFSEMVGNLRVLVEQISQTTSSLAFSVNQLKVAARDTGASAENLATTIEELAQGASTQAAAAQQTAQAVSNMNRSLQKVEEGAQAVGKVANYFQQLVEAGHAAMAALTNKMQLSISSSQQVEVAIRELNQRSQEISQIVEVITSIASQTNLLALNAAIEAARAGELGRGFAVVADEVRKLAEGSAQAAQQIAHLIHDIQSGTEKTVEQVLTAIQVINDQADSVEQTEKLFSDIEKGAIDINREFNAAMQAMHQVSRELQQILHAVQSISAITQESAASTEEVSAIAASQAANAQTVKNSTEEIARLSQELEKAVGHFRL